MNCLSGVSIDAAQNLESLRAIAVFILFIHVVVRIIKVEDSIILDTLNLVILVLNFDL